jgi:hypothetical protein
MRVSAVLIWFGQIPHDFTWVKNRLTVVSKRLVSLGTARVVALMGFSPVLRPAVRAESLSRQKGRFAALRAEANKRLKPVLPLVRVYCTGK